ncbi:hypothetical protein ID866_8857 [Astraeus odoratus]|nr:hypothetical protein ID866_8857 [Astraeus odoratus]
MTIYSYVDSYPDIPQSDLVQYFSTLTTRALIFTQSMLSCKLCDHSCINSSPSALSSKRSCIVTWLDVDHALYLWVQHMESKGESVTGPMLQAKCSKNLKFLKRKGFQERVGCSHFCKTYKIWEHWQHGEAG